MPDVPDIAAYDESMKSAKYCLIPAHLRHGTVRQDQQQGVKNRPSAMKIVWAKSGTYAVFYQLNMPSGPPKGVRCFLTRVGLETKERYATLSRILPQQASQFTVGFQFHEKGIKTRDGQVHPIVEMDFADGRTLVEEVKELCQQHAQSRKCTHQAPCSGCAALKALAKSWQDLAVKLDSLQMAHGDLSGENIMVLKNRSVVLIDYDGIYYNDATLLKYPSHEIGNERYQHRDVVVSGKRAYNERMDDFSVLAIHVALLAFAEKPELFQQFGNPGDGKLLYSKEDLASPGKSAVFTELRKCRDAELARLVSIFEKAATGKLRDIPRFVSLIDPTLNLRGLVRATKRDWRAIHAEAERLSREGKAIPSDSDVQQAVAEATNRCDLLKGLLDAAQARPLRARSIAAAYELPQQMGVSHQWDKATWDEQTWNECEKWISIGARSVRQVAKLVELEKAVLHDRGPKGVVALWKQPHFQELLSDCEEGKYWAQQYDEWKSRNEACDRLLVLVDFNPPWISDVAVADAWRELERVKGHPDFEAVKSAKLPAILGCVQRADCLLAVRRVGTAIDETTDRAFVGTWDDGLLQRCPDVRQEERNRAAAANKRVQALDSIGNSIGSLTGSTAIITEDALAAAGNASKGLPPGYVYKLREELESANEILAALVDPVSDIRLAEAHSHFQKVWGRAAQRVTFHADHTRRISSAVGRAPILIRVRDILKIALTDEHLDEQQDRCLTNGWFASDFFEPPGSGNYSVDAERVRARVESADRRLKALSLLRTATRQVDVLRERAADHIVKAASDVPTWYLHKATIEFNRVQTAIVQSECTRELARELSKDYAAQSDHAVARHWDRLQEVERVQNLSCDPGAEPFRNEAVTACDRSRRLAAVEEVHLIHDEASDRRIADLWIDQLFDRRLDAQRFVGRVGLARQRLAMLDALRRTIARIDRIRAQIAASLQPNAKVARPDISADDGEAAIVAAAATSPLDDTYLRKLGNDEYPRVSEARNRARLTSVLNEAVTSNRDETISRAWKDLEAAKGDPNAEVHRTRAQLAVRRMEGLNELRRILAQQLPLDQEDDRLLAIWSKYSLADSADATGHRDRISLAARRTSTCRELLAALDLPDDFRVRELYNANLALLQQYPPVIAHLDDIESAVKRSEGADELLRALTVTQNSDEFIRLFDCSIVERYPQRFGPLMPRIRDWLQAKLFRAYPLSQDRYNPPSLNGHLTSPEMTVHWFWPSHRKITHCILSARWDEKMEYHRNSHPVAERKISRKDFDESNSCATLKVPAENGRVLHVSIWPAVELRVDGVSEAEPIIGPPLTFEIDPNRPDRSRQTDQKQPDTRGWFGKLLDFMES